MPTGKETITNALQKARTWFIHTRASLQKSVFLRRWWREALVLSAACLTIAVPFLLRPSEKAAPSRYDRRLVIVTPHHEKIRQEFGRAFAQRWKERTGETLFIDWRVAGTGDIALMLRSDYAGAFEYYWTRVLSQPWTAEVAGAFGDGRVKLSPVDTGDDTVAQKARRAFLASDVSVGIDLFFGGGTPDFESQARSGFLVSGDSSGKTGLAAIMATHPDWFSPEMIPQNVSGESFYDAEKRWAGACLSSMGIIFNHDVLRRKEIGAPPAQWADLADPRYFGQVALADPNKSGTVTRSLDQLIQQQMHLAIAELREKKAAFKSEKELVDAGVRIGWTRGLQLIQRIAANSRYFTDNATKIPLEVSQGDAAAGMCIDFYGFSFEELVRKPDGTSRVGFVVPVGGTSVSVDPIGMLRGAPEPEVATAFMEFVLSEDGQKLWNYNPGTRGGPVQHALRRLPVRKDMYSEAHRSHMTDPRATPYDDARAFIYHPERTGQLFHVLRLLVKVMCVENHDDLRRAWKMIVTAEFPKRSTEMFGDLSLVNYDSALKLASTLAKKDKSLELRKVQELSALFRLQYARVYELAAGGQ